MPRRFSCGRHRFEGSASADRPATARAMARRAAGEALAIIPMSATSHSCSNTRCKEVNLALNCICMQSAGIMKTGWTML